MKTNLIKKIGASLMVPALAMSMLLLSPHLLSNVDNNEANVVEQDTTLQDSPIVIVGKVVDLDHQPLEGVVVKDNNSDIEKLTDGEGKFELSFDKATVVSFKKMGFYNVDFNAVASDSSLVIILTPESNQLIVKGYNSPAVKSDDEAGVFDIDTTSTLKEKYDLRKDSIDNQSMKMDKWRDKMDATHMKKESHMHMHDSLKNMKKDMKHDMDTTKDHKDLNYFKKDTTEKLNNSVFDMK